MSGFSWSLLLKPIIGLAIAAAYYVFVVKGLRWLYPRIPKNRFVDFLFRERGDGLPDYGPGHITDPATRTQQSQSVRLEPPSARAPE